MSRFKGEIYGGKMPKKKLSGLGVLHTHLCTWNHGIQVTYEHQPDNTIKVSIYETDGELSRGFKKLVTEKIINHPKMG